MKKTTLQIIECKKCKSSWLVGINRKDIRGIISSRKKTKLKNYFAIGNNELENCPMLKEKFTHCKKCNTLCKIKKIKENLKS